MPQDFRGRLKKITWNVEDNVKHEITEENEEWLLFSQVGERPEIVVNSTWLDTLELSGTVRLRVMFSFDTFRQNPDWYAYLYLKTINGDNNAAYLSGSTANKSGKCEDDCCCTKVDIDDETDDSLV